MRVTTPLENVSKALRDYGEDELANKVLTMSAEQISRMEELAGSYAVGGRLIAQAVALAAVEVLEGKSRNLRRSRRRPGSLKNRNAHS